jgi:hypothetical protein
LAREEADELHRKLIAIQIDRNTNSKQKQTRDADGEDGKEQNGNGNGGDQTPKACQSPVKKDSPWPPPPPSGILKIFVKF